MPKRKLNSKYCFPLIFVLLFVFNESTAQTVSFKSLLEEMGSRESIARFPSPVFTSCQASSYDRNAVSPEEGWYANKDNANFIRVEENNGRKEFVMLDEQGPGAIVRFWMTLPSEIDRGVLRFYIDGNTSPVMEGSVRKILGGAQLVGYPLSGSEPQQSEFLKRGYNLYLPIPYAKSCKVTYESEFLSKNESNRLEAVFYNINFRKYEKNTQVVSFKTDQIKTEQKLVEQVNELLHTQYFRPDNDTEFIKRQDIQLESGKSYPIEVNGEKAINKISLKINAADLAKALRTTIIEAEFDGQQTVWSPIGDFFGTGYHLRTVRNFYTQVDESGWMTCYWTMPFSKNAKIELTNIGNQLVTVEAVELASKPWEWDEQSMYFGASWRQYSSLYTSVNDEHFDVNYTELQGQGVYVGDVLTLFNTLNGWWGEGDEKIYVDGETFPSHFGTGTEDYYGYAWSRWENFFSHPYIGQPDGSGNMNPGYVVNLRVRGLDAIPFHKSLKVDMEMWHWFKHTRINYAPTCFFYLRPDAKCNVLPDPENARYKLPESRADIFSQDIENGAFELENAIILNNNGENAIFQYSEQWGFSAYTQLHWRADDIGDELTVAFNSDEKGKAKILANLTKAPDYGKFDFYFNGKKMDKQWDGYDPSGVIVEKVDLGTVELKKGQNTFSVKCVENARDLKLGLIGLDRFDFEHIYK